MVDDRTALMSARALSPGYEILWYTIDRVLGQGGFGITYLAHDRNLDRAVAIKEYLPTTFAYRHEDYSVKPITGDHRENFVWGLGSFLKEAQTLARFSHPNVVRVHSVFEENNTAYMVMEYEHGDNLATLYKQRENLGQAFFEQMFYPIFDGLKDIHKFDFIHRDIKPANIYIREDGTPVLIDFGSARQTTQQQTSEITTLVSQGYTPLEQYSANYGDQGPWTDIYALAATMYEGIVGRKPDESLSRSACLMRSKPDLLELLDAQVFQGFSQQFLNGVFAGLKLEPEGRPQSLEAWSEIFRTGSAEFPAPTINTGFGTGFTALEDDRTRLQPRKPVSQEPTAEFDSFAVLPGSSTSPTSTSTRLDTTGTYDAEPVRPATSRYQSDDASRSYRPAEVPTRKEQALDQGFSADNDTGFLPADDLLDFDDADLGTASSVRTERPANSTQRPAKSRKKGPGLAVAALALLVAVGGGGAFYLMRGGDTAQSLSAASLKSLARPEQAFTTSLPKEQVLAQLGTMATLAPLLDKAYDANPEDAELLETIRSTESTLLSLAKQWNATKHTDVADEITVVSRALPEAVHDQSRIQGVLAAADQVSANASVLALLDEKRYTSPAGNSVLDAITTVSANDYEQLSASAQWQQMMSEFVSTALNSLEQSNYESAARIVEAALTMDPENEGFNALRTFLAGQ